jgi:predicted nucleic acid-binding protein
MNGAGPLVDTSVLIDYFNGIDSRETGLLDKLLERGPAPAIAAIIVQEYLQGLLDPEEFALAEADLEYFERLPLPDYSVHLRAAEGHVKMKRAGVTIPTIDTLIVTLADAAGCPLLTRDRRQIEFARFLKVRLL